MNQYVMHPLYKVWNLNPLGVIRIPESKLNQDMNNIGKITTEDSLVQLWTTETTNSLLTHYGR